jgi:hypothetical protein
MRTSKRCAERPRQYVPVLEATHLERLAAAFEYLLDEPPDPAGVDRALAVFWDLSVPPSGLAGNPAYSSLAKVSTVSAALTAIRVVASGTIEVASKWHRDSPGHSL